MTATTGLIDAQGMTRRDARSGKVLLAPTDFSLRAGMRVAVTGPSGSGKSVLLRALALLDPLDGGRVLWRGKPIRRSAIPRYRRSVAYLRQRPAQTDGTVESQLRYPYSLAVYRDLRFDRARAEQLAARAGRGADFLDKRASELSGGEAQIAALLRVLQLDPDVLLLDEPTSALDVSVQAEILNLLRRLHRERALTMILVSHNLAVVGFLCQRVAVMQHGEIVELLGVEDVRTGQVERDYTRSLLRATEGYRRLDPALDAPAA